MKFKKLLLLGLLTTQVIGITACGNKGTDDTKEVIESSEDSSSTETPEYVKETYIDDSGKKIEKVSDDEGPVQSSKPLYETVGNVIKENLNEDEIIRDSMKQNTDTERQVEDTEIAEETKQENYEFNGSTVTLTSETLPEVIQVYDPAVNESRFEDVVKFGQVYLQVNSSVNQIGYRVETDGNKGYIKLNNGKQVTVIQLHQGNVGTEKFTDSVQVSTIQKYTGVSLAGAQMLKGIQIDSDIERLNIYTFNNTMESVCLYKTTDGIYIIRWTGSEYGDGDYLSAIISLTV